MSLGEMSAFNFFTFSEKIYIGMVKQFCKNLSMLSKMCAIGHLLTKNDQIKRIIFLLTECDVILEKLRK